MIRMRSKWPVALALFPFLPIFIWACQKHVFIFQGEGNIEGTSKSQDIRIVQKSDIVFVVDNSGSMKEEQDTLKKEINYFVERLAQTNNDFRIALTTTDNQSDVRNTSRSCDRPFNPSGEGSPTDPLPGTHPIHHGRCGRFISPATASEPFLKRGDFKTPDEIKVAFGKFVDLLGVGGSSQEQSLRAAWLATGSELTKPDGPNAGFFREDALLMVIILTDESDCSFDPSLANSFSDTNGALSGYTCYTQTGSLLDPIAIAEQIKSLKSDPTLVKVGLISASVRGADGKLNPSACRTDTNGQATDMCSCFLNVHENYCNFFQKAGRPQMTFYGDANRCTGSTCCTAMYNDRLMKFAAQFDSYADSICRNSYADTLLAFANILDRQCFEFDKPPLNNNLSNIQFKIIRKGTTDELIIPNDDRNGWYYVAQPKPQVCLAGDAKTKDGDKIKLFVLNKADGDTSSIKN